MPPIRRQALMFIFPGQLVLEWVTDLTTGLTLEQNPNGISFELYHRGEEQIS